LPVAKCPRAHVQNTHTVLPSASVTQNVIARQFMLTGSAVTVFMGFKLHLPVYAARTI
jgi:hypothetical protein